MVGFFVKSGDIETSREFLPYREPFRDIIVVNLEGKIYSKDLKLILIQYPLEGKYLALPPKQVKINRYRPKELSTGATIAISKDFYKKSEKDKKEFIVNIFLESMELIRKQIKRLGLQVNFDALIADLNACCNLYLAQQKRTISLPPLPTFGDDRPLTIHRLSSIVYSLS